MATAIKTVLADVVKETSITTGTSTLSLDGAVTGFQTLVAAIGDSNYTFYSISDGTDWEIGFGLITDATPDTLTRTKILNSSNSGSAVDWAAGTRVVRCVNSADVIQNGLKLWATKQTTDATVTILDLFGISGAEIAIASGTTLGVQATVVGRVSAVGTIGDSYLCHITALVKNVAGTTSVVDTPTIDTTNDEYQDTALATATVTVTANDTDDTVQIKVTGVASNTIEWKAFIEVYEV